ncbi:hypothetical protein DFQ03_2390 [Maribacter caenipelagi]|uniref:Uncharacterized protein n=1 Tax=Maribacter caenipelagi TaxID=1447781 RepID=A0A4V3E1R5_9FLAO|nr:hypothetical protein DFQ03_2390 [Maribacter caenipelagi]
MKYIICAEPHNFKLLEKDMPLKKERGSITLGAPSWYLWNGSKR